MLIYRGKKINLGWAHHKACKNLTSDIRTKIHRCHFVYLFPHISAKPSYLHVTSSFSTLPIVPWSQQRHMLIKSKLNILLAVISYLVLINLVDKINIPLETDWNDTTEISSSPYPIDRDIFLNEWNFLSGTYTFSWYTCTKFTGHCHRSTKFNTCKHIYTHLIRPHMCEINHVNKWLSQEQGEKQLQLKFPSEVLVFK